MHKTDVHAYKTTDMQLNK